MVDWIVSFLALCFSALLLSSCAAIPTSDRSGLFIEIVSPAHSDDVGRAEDIVDEFSKRYALAPRSGVDVKGRAGDGFVKGLGYSGSLRTLRANVRTSDVSQTARESLPYQIGLFEGENKQLFFVLALSNDDYTNSKPVVELLQTIRTTFGVSRVRIAQPTITEWLMMGD